MEINRGHIIELDSNTQIQINDAAPSADNAWAYGKDVQAITAAAHAEGTETLSGGMGYYIESIVDDKIYLSSSNKPITPSKSAPNNGQPIFDCGYKLPEKESLIVYIQSDEDYQWPFIEITNINGNILTYNTSSTTLGKSYYEDESDVQPHILYCLAYPTVGVIPIGANAHAEGLQTIAAANETHAEGRATQAVSQYAHAEGFGTTAGYAAHSEGYNTKAKGFYSHAEGKDTQAIGPSSHAEGEATQAIGNESHTEGHSTRAIGNQSHAEGFHTTATAFAQHVQGKYNINENTDNLVHIIGWGTKEQPKNIHTLDTQGNAYYEGKVQAQAFESKDGTQLASTDYVDTKINMIDTTVYATKTELNEKPGKQEEWKDEDITGTKEMFGTKTQAEGRDSHAEGNYTRARGKFTHAEGQRTSAFGDQSHAEGHKTTANGYGTHTEGIGTYASKAGQHVQGKYNLVLNPTVEEYYGTTGGEAGDYVHIVGNGKSDSERSNCHTLDWDGNAWFAGNLRTNINKPTNSATDGAFRVSIEEIPSTSYMPKNGLKVSTPEDGQNNQLTKTSPVFLPLSTEETIKIIPQNSTIRFFSEDQFQAVFTCKACIVNKINSEEINISTIGYKGLNLFPADGFTLTLLNNIDFSNDNNKYYLKLYDILYTAYATYNSSKKLEADIEFPNEVNKTKQITLYVYSESAKSWQILSRAYLD